jgi:hypothetical protein
VNDDAPLVDACQTLHARFSAMWLHCPTCPPGRSPSWHTASQRLRFANRIEILVVLHPLAKAVRVTQQVRNRGDRRR